MWTESEGHVEQYKILQTHHLNSKSGKRGSEAKKKI